MDHPGSEPSESLEMARRINVACDSFEAQLIRNESPSIEEYLDRGKASDRDSLCRELVILEVEYRCRRQDLATVDEYIHRFKELSFEWLSELITSKTELYQTGTSLSTPTIELPAQTANWNQNTMLRYFGDYELLTEIARGGMGIVYKARQVSLDRIVAIKRVTSGSLATQHEIDRFNSEAKLAAQLDHPNIVPLFEVGTHDGEHYLSMGFVDGCGLDRFIDDVLPSPRESAKIMACICRAVHYAHEHQIIHRDLKPSNILIDKSGMPKISDFGLAKRLDEKLSKTVSGQVLGTPSYMPPEQAAGRIEAVGPHSDIYSLGAVLYVLLTGRPPFKGTSVIQTLNDVIVKEPIRPKVLNTNIPRDLETIALKCLEKSIAKRYPSAQHVAEELDRFLDQLPILARPISPMARGWRWCCRNPWLSTVSALFLISVFIGSAVSGYYGWKNRRLAISESKARVDAENQRDVANGLNELITQDIFGQVDIWNQNDAESSISPNITVQATLDRSASKVGQRFSTRPRIEAEVRRALGGAYFAMGEHNKAIEQLENALELIDLHTDATSETVEQAKLLIETMYTLAKSYWLAQRGAQADSMFRKALKDSIECFGDHSRQRIVLQTALAHIYLNKDVTALELLEELEPLVAEYYQPDDVDSLHFQNTLGLAQQQYGKMEQALVSFTTGYAHANASLGPNSPLTMMLQNNCGRWYLVNHRPAQALESSSNSSLL